MGGLLNGVGTLIKMKKIKHDSDAVYEVDKLKAAGETFQMLGDAYGELDLIRGVKIGTSRREVVAEQLYDMSRVLNEYTGGNSRIIEIPPKKLMKFVNLMKSRNVSVKKVCMIKRKKKYLEFTIEAKLKKSDCVTSREAAGIISSTMDRRFLPDEASRRVLNKEYNLYTFIEEARYNTMYGVSKKCKDGNDVSGDNFSVCSPGCIRTVICLADGMGSGSRANQESALMIELLEKFLEAGFSEMTAIKMINTAFATDNYKGDPVTLDIGIIDKYNGEMKMIKMGAAPTFIKRKDNVEIITSTSLPAGVLDMPDIEMAETDLRDGDMVIFVSDGVMEEIDSFEKERTFAAMISEINCNNAEIMAETILDMVLGENGKPADDMTVVVVGVWKKW